MNRALLNAARQQAMKIAPNMPQHQTCIAVMEEGILCGGQPGVLKEAIVCSIPSVIVFTWTVKDFLELLVYTVSMTEVWCG